MAFVSATLETMYESFMDPFHHPVPVVLTIVSGTLGVLWVLQSRRNKKQLPPSPKGNFLLGNMLDLSDDNMHLDFIRMQKRDNLPDIMTLRFGPTFKMIILNSYDTIKDMFASEGELFAARAQSPMSEVMGLCDEITMTTSTDPTFKNGKAFLFSALRAAGFNTVNSVESKVASQMDVLIEYLEPYIKDKKPIKLKNVTLQVAANVIGEVLNSKTYPLDDPILLENTGKLRKLFKMIAATFVMEFLPRWLGWLLFRNKVKEIRQITNDLIQPFRDAIKDHRETLDPNNLRDFMDIYLSKKEGPIDDEILAHTTFIFYPDAVDTTGGLLDWILLRVASQIEVQKKILEEIDTKVGDARAVTYSDRHELPYTEAVIAEVMRLCCMSVMTMGHSAIEDTYYKGFFIPKNVPIYGNIYAALMDPAYFEDPDEFRPERFLSKDGKFCNSEAVIPFSIGRRKCMGESLVKMETFLLVVRLLQRYTLRIPDGEEQPQLTPTNINDRTPPAFPLLIELRK